MCEGLPEISKQLVYDEPTVMWRMWRGDVSSHVVITPRAAGAVVEWFLNDHPLGSRDFSDWSDALRWSEQMQAQNWAVGWRHL
jgi:predicted YcjX-like family ATPase